MYYKFNNNALFFLHELVQLEIVSDDLDQVVDISLGVDNHLAMIKLMHSNSHELIVVFEVIHLASFLAVYVGKEASIFTHSLLPQKNHSLRGLFITFYNIIVYVPFA